MHDLGRWRLGAVAVITNTILLLLVGQSNIAHKVLSEINKVKTIDVGNKNDE